MKLSVDPGVLVLLLTSGILYWRAIRVLAGRGRRVSRWQQASWYGGLALLAAGLLSPIDYYSDDLLSAHMAQHLLIADLAAPFLIVGLRTPVLVFLLPRPVLVPLSRQRWLRKTFRTVRQPLVAIPIFILSLYFWHLQFAFVGALRNPYVHLAQHTSFVVASLLVWWSALEPKRARMPGGLWKIGHIGAVRMASMFLGVAFVFMRAPAYAAYYGNRSEKYGLSPLVDQQTAGGMMMTLDILVIVFTLTLFFWRAASDNDREEAAAAATEREDATVTVAPRPT